MTTRADLPMPPELSAPQLKRVREVSKAMFGNVDRLVVAVGVAMSPDATVNATDLQWDLRLANNRVRAQLLALAELGLLQPAPMEGLRGRRVFRRVSDPFWTWCVDLYAKALRS